MILERIIYLLEKEIASAEHSLLQGTCPDYVSYRELVAILTSLRTAIDIVKKAFAEDDEE
jgi:hypothetical protein